MRPTAALISELLRVGLVKAGVYEVLDRSSMKEILGEQVLQLTGVTDPDTAVKTGKLLSCQKLFVGQFTKLGKRYILTFQCVDVETGKVDFADSTQASAEEDLPGSAEYLVGRMLKGWYRYLWWAAPRFVANAAGRRIVTEAYRETEKAAAKARVTAKSIGGHEEAAELYARSADLAPSEKNKVEATFMNKMMRGRTAELKGDKEQAAELYREAERTAPDEDSRKAAKVNLDEMLASRPTESVPAPSQTPVSEREHAPGPIAPQPSPQPVVGPTVAAKPAGARRGSPGSDGAPMVLIPAGEFTMGSNDGSEDERPPHRVSISAFYMDKYEVTYDLYDKFCEVTGRTKHRDPGWGRGNRPVVGVSWGDAVAYATHYGKRLPTEAEWEYACRAGGTGTWCFGNDLARLREYAWYLWNSEGRTHAVGERTPNAWGLFDMHGNAWEWCGDWYAAGYYASSPAQDPSGPVSGQYRVLRGGGWDADSVQCRSAVRNRYDPGGRYDGFDGFRCAMSRSDGLKGDRNRR